MAQFNIDSHLSDGKSLQWLALPDAGEQPLDVEVKVRQAAMKKFDSPSSSIAGST
ncbi:hypothetical protein AAAC13_00295 [Pseudomonas aeruginosa]